MNQEEAKIFAAELRNDVPTIDLHNVYPQEALEKLELFLYDQVQQKHEVIKVVYGGGKGVLKNNVITYLHRHPLVDTIVEQGGSCITILYV